MLETDTGMYTANTILPEKIWSDTVDKRITWDVMHNKERLPQLELIEIGEQEYLKYKTTFQHPPFINDGSKLTQTDSFFVIQTSKAKLKYTKEYNKNYGNRNGFYWTNYKGYVNPLHLYVMENWGAGEFTLGELFLVDSTTNIPYAPRSFTDGPFEILMLSPDSKHIAIGLEGQFEIGYLSNAIGIISYKGIAYGNPGGEFDDVLWVNDRLLVVKLRKQLYNETTQTSRDTFNYVQAIIPVKLYKH